MKQGTILWLSAIIITLITGYIYRNSAPDFPVSGSERLEGKRIHYLLQTKYSADDDYAVIVKSDLPGLSGTVEYKMNSQDQAIQSAPLSERKNLLTARLPKCRQNEKLIYRVILNRGNKTFSLPASSYVIAKSTEYVPLTVKILFFLTLIGGFTLSARTGLDYFSGNANAKKLALLTLALFLINAIVFTPLKRAFESGINTISLLPVTGLFSLSTVLISFGWVITFAILNKMPAIKSAPLFMFIISLILFITVY